jgi:hypothetical protein
MRRPSRKDGCHAVSKYELFNINYLRTYSIEYRRVPFNCAYVDAQGYYLLHRCRLIEMSLDGQVVHYLDGWS